MNMCIYAYNINKGGVCHEFTGNTHQSKYVTPGTDAKNGINFRSLLDYEQGHKKLSSASGDVLLRLSTVPGSSAEEPLLPDDFPGAPLLPGNTLDVATIQCKRFYCDKYQTTGWWICSGGKIATVFCYDGKQCCLPFRAIFKPEPLYWLKESVILQMEDAIEVQLFAEFGFQKW